jgi:hypothetical protein
LTPTRTAFAITTKPKEQAPREKISLIKTETANAITAAPAGNALELDRVAEKDRAAGTDAEKARGKETLADKVSTGMDVHPRAAHRLQHRKSKLQHIPESKYAGTKAYFDSFWFDEKE